MSPDATPIRILFVEDSEDDCFLVARHLRTEGFTPEHRRVDSRENFIEAIDNEKWDVILSDHSMPLFSSLNALQTLHDHGLDIPFVIVSGMIGEEEAVAAMRAGARDYVLKHNLGRLAQVLTREMREVERRRKHRAVEAALHAAEDQLQHAQKMEAIGRLASGVAHDFNNLLTAILGFSGFALEQIEAENPLRRDLEQVVMAAERATRLTSQLLAFSRQQPKAPRVTNLNEVVTAIMPMLTRLIGADVRINALLAPDAPAVLLDPGQLEQVLMNLAVNARDAMPNGGSLTITSWPMRLDETSAPMFGVPVGDYAALAVRDTGHGMDEAIRARVFEPFFTTKREGEGTGLGLATVYAIVTQSSGGVRLQSAPGEGTAFTIVFPAVAWDTYAEIHAGTPAELRGSETILVIENDPTVASLVRIVLSGAGYAVVNAVNEIDAAAKIDAMGGADLLLTNLVVGSVTGRDIARRLWAKYPNLRLLYLTGHTAHSAMPVDLPLVDDTVLLRKPFTPTQLLAAVRARLSGEHADRAPNDAPHR